MSDPQDFASHPYRGGEEPNTSIIVTTGNKITGYRIIKYLGLIRGLSFKSITNKHGISTKEISKAFNSLTQDEPKQYIDIWESLYQEAYNQIIKKAEQLGATALVGMRCETNIISQYIRGTHIYGTAVRVTPE